MENQNTNARKPRQERSRQKVELILEATVRLLEKGGLDALTTNAVAATAGVSIGTLYQYFPNKEAILDALADREMQEMSGRVMAVMQDATIMTPHDRIAAVVRAVAASYERRYEAHRLVMAHSLARGGNRLAPLLSRMRAHLATQRSSGAHMAPFEATDAFVLTHAMAGVLRAMISESDAAPEQAAIEQSLTRLVVNFLR